LTIAFYPKKQAAHGTNPSSKSWKVANLGKWRELRIVAIYVLHAVDFKEYKRAIWRQA